MNIEIKKSQKPVKYEDAVKFMEKRLLDIDQKKSDDLIWILEHEDLYTAGTSYKESEIIDKSIKILKTNRDFKPPIFFLVAFQDFATSFSGNSLSPFSALILFLFLYLYSSGC